MRQVRVQGCLPTLLVLAVMVALGAVAVTAGLAVLAGTAAMLVVLTVARALRRLSGRAPVTPPRIEAVPPGWISREDGPIVEAGPRGPSGGDLPRGARPPGERPGEGGPDVPVGPGERTLPPRV
jgi:hypothetical protein